MRKLTSEDRERLKNNFRNSKFGHYLLKFLYEYKGIWFVNALFAWEFSYYFIIGTINLTDFTPQPNILYGLILWHAYSHHLTDLLCFGIGYTIMSIRMKNFIYPALWIGFIIATTEYSWWFSYIIAHWEKIFILDQWERIYFSNQLTIVYAILIIGYGAIKGFSRKDLVWIIMLWEFMIVWIYLGFPITYDFNGSTNLANDLQTNAIEVLHWIWSFVWFFIIVDYKNIRIRFLR